MDIVKKFLKTSIELENYYYNFWKKIYNNDAYIFMKNAIEFYKNIQNEKFHDFYSGIINIRLYTGKCIIVNQQMLNTFNNENKTSSDELCNLTIQTINILDNVFDVCPRLPFDTITFRSFTLNRDNLLLGLQDGDFYRELGIYSTTINPFKIFDILQWGYYDDYSDSYSIQKAVYLTIILPKNTKCYYISIGNFIKNKGFGLNEYEIVLPRDCVYLIKSKKIYKNRYFITLELVHQIPPKDRIIEGTDEILPSRIPGKKEIKKYKKTYKECKIDECKWMIAIAKKSFEKWNILPQTQKYPAEYMSNIYEKIHPKKCWTYVYFYDKIFKKIQKNEPKIIIDLPKNTKIYTNNKYLYLEEKLSDGFCFNYIKKNNNNFFEIDRNTPLFYFIEIDKCKEMMVKKDYAYIWNTTKKIKIIIKSIIYVNIIDEFKYGIVKASFKRSQAN